jgi:hypothetical protein
MRPGRLSVDRSAVTRGHSYGRKLSRHTHTILGGGITAMSSRPDPLAGAEDEEEEEHDDGYVEAEDEDFAASEEEDGGGEDDSDADEGGGKRKRRKGDADEGGGKRRSSRRSRGSTGLDELRENTDAGVDADELADLEAERLAVYGADVVRGSRAASVSARAAGAVGKGKGEAERHAPGSSLLLPFVMPPP